MDENHKEIDNFLLQKWQRVFNAFFDTDSSQVINWGDFYLVTKKVRGIYGADSVQMEYARKSLKALWDGLVTLADRNHDDQVTMDEWIQVLQSGDFQHEPKWFADYGNFIFKLMDVSQDEVLDLAEYTDGMVTYGFSEDEAHEAFHKFAVDARGKPIKAIPYSQFKKLWKEYFYSTDAKALGNYLFGMIQ